FSPSDAAADRERSETENGPIRKRIIGRGGPEATGESGEGWFDLDRIATVEVTSELPGFSIESALTSQEGPGWRAAEAGEQQIRIIFDEPVSVRRIQLHFQDSQFE